MRPHLTIEMSRCRDEVRDIVVGRLGYGKFMAKDGAVERTVCAIKSNRRIYIFLVSRPPKQRWGKYLLFRPKAPPPPLKKLNRHIRERFGPILRILEVA